MSVDLKQVHDDLDAISGQGRWKTQTGIYNGENWLVGSFGSSGIDGQNYHVTTDHVHASECGGDAKIDADFVATAPKTMRQMAAEIEQLRDEIERLKAGIEVALEPDESESPFDVLHCVLQGEDYREDANEPETNKD